MIGHVDQLKAIMKVGVQFDRLLILGMEFSSVRLGASSFEIYLSPVMDFISVLFMAYIDLRNGCKVFYAHIIVPYFTQLRFFMLVTISEELSSMHMLDMNILSMKLLTVLPFCSSEVTEKLKLIVSAKHSLLQAASSLPSDISQLQPQSVIPV